MLPPDSRHVIAAALEALGVDNLVLAIHDASFPGEPGDDAGRGSPYSAGAARFFELARGLGFTGVQLGPQGQTSEANASPYDGTAFSRNVLSIALRDLVVDPSWGSLLDAGTLSELAGGAPAPSDRAHHRYASRAQRIALDRAFARLEPGAAPDVARRLRRFADENAAWLERDALYTALCEEHGAPTWRAWRRDGEPHPDQDLWAAGGDGEGAREARRRELVAKHRRRIDRHAFGQLIAHEQHAALRARLRSLGLTLQGDLQIGLSVRDTWSYQAVLLRDYVMGAPPSRTNPEGQPWGYPVLDPAQYFAPEGGPGPALRLLAKRMDKMFAAYDAVRIDHPHGLVCPWVYRADAEDPGVAVRGGARLFSSPDLPDYPGLAKYAIVPPSRIRHDVPRHDDHRVPDPTDEEVERYGAQLDVIAEAARRHGRKAGGLVCEVLSTQPVPLARVLARHGLGRFRVTQKANLRDPADVYRTENAREEDWCMVGTHDTPPIWRVIPSRDEGSRRLLASHLAARLSLDAAARDELERGVGAVVHGLFADIFACRARNVMIFFSDLFGLDDVYNAPGTVSDANWSLRLTPDFDRRYLARLAEGRALSLPRALATAIRARGEPFAREHRDLTSALDRLSRDLEAIAAS